MKDTSQQTPQIVSRDQYFLPGVRYTVGIAAMAAKFTSRRAQRGAIDATGVLCTHIHKLTAISHSGLYMYLSLMWPVTAVPCQCRGGGKAFSLAFPLFNVTAKMIWPMPD